MIGGDYRCVITNLATNSIFDMLEVRTQQFMESLAIGAGAILRTDPAPYELDAAIELIMDESARLTDNINVEAKKLGCNFADETAAY